MVFVTLSCYEPNAQRNFTLARELDRVVEDVDKDLFDPFSVAKKPSRNERIFEQLELDLPFFDIVRHDAYDIVDHLVNAKRSDLELHLACFDLGKIQYVIDYTQHVLGCQINPVNI